MGGFSRVAWGCARRVRACGVLGVVRLACGWALLTGLIALVVCASAVAARGHGFRSRLSEGPVGVVLREPGAVAVDHVSGEVFVADPGRGVVDVFSSAGGFVTRFGGGVLEAQSVAVDEASGDVYVTEPVADVVLVFRPDGVGGYVLFSEWLGVGVAGGAFGEVAGVAVDNSRSVSDPSAGDVYVVDRASVGRGRGVVDVFRPKPVGSEEAMQGDFVRSLKGGRLEEPNGVAVSAATGRVYVADSVKGVVYGFSALGVLESRMTGKGSPEGSFRGKEKAEEGNVSAVAVDETTGDVLVAEAERRVVGELGAAGEWVGWVTGTPAGGFGEPRGVAVGSSGGLYVADAGSHVVDVFGAGVVVPDVTTRTAAKVRGTSAVLRGTVNGDGKPVSYHFEWGETELYGGLAAALKGCKGQRSKKKRGACAAHARRLSAPVVKSAGAGEGKVAVTLTGLKPGATYYFRLVGENENGSNCGVGRAFTTLPGVGSGTGLAASVACQLPPPAVDGESVAEVGSVAASLQAQINPLGHEASYQFQYGAESCQTSPGSCTSVPQPPVDVGGGESDVAVSVRVGGLKPGATYYYRVIATSSLGTTKGTEHTFTTPGLPQVFALSDNRAWELVTPPDKHGAAVEALTSEGGLILAAEDGNALAYVADGAISEEAQGNRSPEMQQVLARRGAEGWSSGDIATPNSSAQGVSAGSPPEYQYFSPDLSRALVQPWATKTAAEPPLAAEATQATMYVRDNQAGSYLPLVTEANVAPGTVFGAKVHFVSATADLRHAVLRSTVALTGPSSAPGLYEWSGGALRFLSVLPNGAPAAKPALGYYNVAANAISSDGTRVVWTNTEENSGRGHLYMSDSATGQTLQLDVAQGIEEPNETGVAQFQAATVNGSKVFFTDKQRLTSDSTAEPGAENAGRPDLYECEIAEAAGKLSCKLRDLTLDRQSGGHADVQGFIFGAGEDGSSLYLVAQGVLDRGPNPGGQRAQVGAENLYALHEEGGKWSTRFIATLSPRDEAQWNGGEHANSAFLTARVSPNGRYLAFMSQASLTGYDNEDVTSRHPGERLDQEVYLYDSASASLRCVSCDPTGARPVGVLDTVESSEGVGLLVDRRKVWIGRWLAGNIPGWTAQSIQSALFQSRYLSNEGRLFFNSADAPLPLERPTRSETVEGTQAQVGVENVYEYEPSGVGSCVSPTGGCVTLLSSGASGNESAFLEATPSGNDVFFLTAAQLVAQDTDTAFDIYDARVCTSESPCLTPPTPAPAGCSSEARCLPASPPLGGPVGPSGTAIYSGPGNPAGQPPAKQEVKGTKTSSTPLTNAQKLAIALRACRKDRSAKKRKACEAYARKLYGPAQKLANALKACKRDHPHSKKKRAACEAHARKLYGPKAKAKKTSTARTGRRAGR